MIGGERVSYRSREVVDRDRIDAFLAGGRVGVLGLAGDDGYPYAVPVNYVWHEGTVVVHGMGSGKRQRLLAAAGPGPVRVCFTVFRDDGTVPDAVPCHADTAYLSVMIFGVAEPVTDPEEAAAALRRIVERFLPGRAGPSVTARLAERYRSALDGKGVAVHRIVPDHLTAKENPRPAPN